MVHTRDIQKGEKLVSDDPFNIFGLKVEPHIYDMLVEIKKEHCTSGLVGAVKFILKDYYRRENYIEKLKDGNTRR